MGKHFQFGWTFSDRSLTVLDDHEIQKPGNNRHHDSEPQCSGSIKEVSFQRAFGLLLPVGADVSEVLGEHSHSSTGSMMRKSPEALLRPSPADPSKPPEPLVCQKQGRLEIDELKRVGYTAGVGYTHGSKPAESSLVEKPETEKWTSPLLKNDSELLLKIAQVSGRSEQNIRGILDRYAVVDPNSYPWCTIGKLFAGWNSNFSSPALAGSGVLVGPNLILTASHLMPWGKPGGWVRFVPAFNIGDEPFGSSYVTECYGVQNTDNVTALDYVICHLDTPLGNTCGWMGTQSWGDDDNYKANSHD